MVRPPVSVPLIPLFPIGNYLIIPHSLYTLIGVKRRGVPPQSIIEFINTLGVTTTNSIIQSSRFEQTVRNYLERTVPRLMLVMDPVPVVIEDAEPIDVTVPFSPKDVEMGSRTVKFTKTVYIDRADFKEKDEPGYFRLAPGKTVSDVLVCRV